MAAYAIGLVVANAFGWGWPDCNTWRWQAISTSTTAASEVSQTGVAADCW
jgi:hypothetical protein